MDTEHAVAAKGILEEAAQAVLKLAFASGTDFASDGNMYGHAV